MRKSYAAKPKHKTPRRNEMKRIIKIGAGTLEKRMTKAQALRYGERTMPSYLKISGFETAVFESDVETNGSVFLRISYGKAC